MYTVENVRAVIDKYLAFADFIARWTKTEVDDNIISVIRTIESNDIAMGILVQFLNSTNKDGKVNQSRVIGAMIGNLDGN